MTLTKVSTIVRDSETNIPEGINTYQFAGKFSRSEIIDMLQNGTEPFEGSNVPEVSEGTIETLDTWHYEKVDISIPSYKIAESADIKTGIMSGPYTPIPFEETAGVKEDE